MPRSNIFEAGAASVADLFSDYLEGDVANGRCIALVLSARTLGEAARDAAEKSLSALGYGLDACTYATLAPTATSTDADEGGGHEDFAPTLDAQALFLLVEGLDPLVVIAADGAATSALGMAYRTTYTPDSAIRVFGRPAVAYADLNAMLSSDDGKQKAWRLFKSVPKRA